MTRALLALLLLVAAYIAAGVGGSLIPVNSDRAGSARDITIHVHDNGIHTGIVLPAAHRLADWSDLVRPGDLPDPRRAGDHLLFGWGDRDFYLETPSWGDLTPGTAVAALFGSEASLLHVDHIAPPEPGPSMRPVRVSERQYLAIAAAIRARFALDAAGRAQPVRGYGRTDVFYAAKGTYSLYFTCNEWTGSVLREAGVRIGAWTPFSFGVMWWF